MGTRRRLLVLSLSLCGPLACVATRAAALGQEPPASQPVLTPAEEKRLAHERELQEIAALPAVEIDSVEKAVRFFVEDGLLAARTTLSPLNGEVRVVHPDLTGVVRVRVHDLQGAGDESVGRNFEFIQIDHTRPDVHTRATQLGAIAGRLNLSRTSENDELFHSVQLIQDPVGAPVEPGDGPVRLLVQVNYDREEPANAARAARGEVPADVNLKLVAYSFTELRQRHPREVEQHLRPILRDLGAQDRAIFAVDERVAWQVLGADHAPDPEAAEQVKQALAKFDSDDFHEREAALDGLKRLGQPAALYLVKADRTNFSPEQNAGVDTFLAEYLPLSPEDAARLRQSTDFLLDTLASEDAALRRLAWAQLKKVVSQPMSFDPDADAQQRNAQIQSIRSALAGVPQSATVPSSK